MNLDDLLAAMPRLAPARATSLLDPLNAALAWAEINTPARVASFLAQVGHESFDFRYFEELASGAAYEGRHDLGNTQPGDGVRFKGRGPIQITGRANYRAFGAAVGEDFEAHPELVAQPEWGFKGAAWFWKLHGLNTLADAGDFDAITRKINGGYNGKPDRDARWALARKALGLAAPQVMA